MPTAFICKDAKNMIPFMKDCNNPVNLNYNSRVISLKVLYIIFSKIFI